MKNFSFLLALRYLNPLRTHVSVITLISLAGVSLGVMVLIVVLSVMDGFEDLIKRRVLGRDAHIISQRVEPWTSHNVEQEWRGHKKLLAQQENVLNAYPLVQDYIFIENTEGRIIQGEMNGIDTLNPQTIEDFKKLIIEGDGDMGAGYVATISSEFQKQHNFMVGDKIELMSSRNLKQLKPIMDQNSFTPFKEQKAAELEDIAKKIKASMVDFQDKEAMPNPIAAPLKDMIVSWDDLDIRTLEKELLIELLELLSTDDYEEDIAGKNFYPKGTRDEALAKVKEIQDLNVYKAVSDAIREVALPKDVEIVAVYQTDIYAPGPQVMVPISLAQELAGNGESESVRGIGIILKDPYRAGQELKKLSGVITNGWKGVTWMDKHKQQFSLISSQKSMMTVALSFIILIAVFSIGAVMFTITYQKKKEIGVMKALGATPMQITQVFTLQGVIVGIFGALIGWGLSILVLWKLDWIQDMFAKFGFNPFDKTFYGVDSMPYIVNAKEVSFVLVGAFILCSLAAFVPAWVASRADAAKSLRNM